MPLFGKVSGKNRVVVPFFPDTVYNRAPCQPRYSRRRFTIHLCRLWYSHICAEKGR